MDWVNGELIHRKTTFINMEYGVPIAGIDQAFQTALEIYQRYQQKGYVRYTPFVMRPVKQDRAGYLSPTIDRDTCFFDMSLQYNTPLEHEFFQTVEAALLELGGRVSWSRLFYSDHTQISQAYPDMAHFMSVKRLLDPHNRFSNNFTQQALGC